MPRKARLDAPGTLHHVIVRGIERREIVSDNRDRENFVNRMGTLAADTGTAIYAWALMPNHAHILLRSGPGGLPRYMRRLLSGYAGWYNRRHRRHGHLFQNRYKSIVCEEDPYFQELVRYIHLNPLRAKLAESLHQLQSYRWCGHAVIVGRRSNGWQDRDYVLRWFGSTRRKATQAYRHFIKQGTDQGRRPELVGGGLIRSQGGWSAVKAMRRLGLKEKSDDRILGSGDFVEQIIRQADDNVKYQLPSHELGDHAAALVQAVCERERVSQEALLSGSRRQNVSKVRLELAAKLVNELGLSLAESARQLGVSTSAIANALRRKKYN